MTAAGNDHGVSTSAVALASGCLLSKWGFNDGDAPDLWIDYLDERGIDYNVVEWPLVALVRKYLLPEVRRHHAIDVCEIETSHNPIRAEHVDGVEIDWRGDNPAVQLTPEWVSVPLSEALEIARAVA